MSPSPRLILAVLAGGESRRFGGSKLRVRIAGEPVLAWQVRRLMREHRGQCRPVEAWLSLAPGIAGEERVQSGSAPAPGGGGLAGEGWPPGAESYARVIRDPAAYGGPLAGVRALLGEAEPGDTLAVVPADMPLVEGRHLDRLAACWDVFPDAAAVMGRWADGPRRGGVEPFPSLWRVAASRTLLASPEWRHARGPRALAASPRVVSLPLAAESDAAAWRSLNRREDLAAFTAALTLPLEAEPDVNPRHPSDSGL